MGNCREGIAKLDRSELRLDDTKMTLQKEEGTVAVPNTQTYGYTTQLTRSSNMSISAKVLSRQGSLSHYGQPDGDYSFKKTPRTQTHNKKVKNVPLYQNIGSTNTLEFEDGSTYTGMVDATTLKPYGKGIFKHACGDVYEGSFFKGMANGQGTYRHADGTVYIGNMSDDMKTGFGEETYVGGEMYKGYFLAGNKRGRGKYYWAEGVHYTGDVVDNQKYGVGKLVTRGGDAYQGNWKKDVMEGRGTMAYHNGDTYEGSFLNNQKHGLGKLTTSDFVYEGSFLNNNIDGEVENERATNYLTKISNARRIKRL